MQEAGARWYAILLENVIDLVTQFVDSVLQSERDQRLRVELRLLHVRLFSCTGVGTGLGSSRKGVSGQEGVWGGQSNVD